MSLVWLDGEKGAEDSAPFAFLPRVYGQRDHGDRGVVSGPGRFGE
jgi:hypothetical protein